MNASLIEEDPLGGLALEPSNELRFKGPSENEFSSVSLKITNPTEKRIAFKVKTTAPKRYCVKPSGGVLDPTLVNGNIYEPIKIKFLIFHFI